MQPLCQLFAALGFDRRMFLKLHVVEQALATAGNAKQGAVIVLVPPLRHVGRLECLVERPPVAVALGFRQGAVNVPQYRVDQFDPRLRSCGSSASDSMNASQVKSRESQPSL